MTPRSAMILVTALTLGRVPLVFLFAVCTVTRAFHPAAAWLDVMAFSALVLAALTDMFDGYFARRLKVTSRFGAHADPLTDKIFYLTVLPVLLFLIARHEGWNTHAVVMLIFTVLFLLRDQWVTFLRSVGSEYGADVRANWSGKLRTAISFPIACAIDLYAAFTPAFLPLPLIYALEIAGIAVNLVSMVIYTRQYLPYLRRAM